VGRAIELGFEFFDCGKTGFELGGQARGDGGLPSETPMGAAYPRSAYSATTLFLVLHRMSPMVGLSSAWRRRSSTAAMYMPSWPRKLGSKSPTLSSITTKHRSLKW
jgi:hypothetical protein